jgi:hypothetical protein
MTKTDTSTAASTPTKSRRSLSDIFQTYHISTIHPSRECKLPSQRLSPLVDSEEGPEVSQGNAKNLQHHEEKHVHQEDDPSACRPYERANYVAGASSEEGRRIHIIDGQCNESLRDRSYH